MPQSSQTPSPEIGRYRPASRLKEGWQLKHGGSWKEIVSVIQVTSPVAFAMLTLADGFEFSVPHTHEVFTRTVTEAARVGVR